MFYDRVLATVDYAILNSPSNNSTLKLTFAFNARNTLKIVSIVTFLAFLSIREIWDFCTPINSPKFRLS